LGTACSALATATASSFATKVNASRAVCGSHTAASFTAKVNVSRPVCGFHAAAGELLAT